MTAYGGITTAAPTLNTSPKEFAPVMLGGLQWPKWGLFVESKGKPSQPWGTVGQAAFGNPTGRAGDGARTQALLALGHQDIDPDGITAPSPVTILGASSDHVVVDTGSTPCPVGSELRFGLNYAALLRAMTSPFVAKVFASPSGLQAA